MTFVAALFLGACGVPQIVTPYRMDIQQGNYLSQEAISQLKPGMTREQVRYLLGSPLVTDLFHADRWDYVYYRDSLSAGREARRISVIFEENRLVRITGDVVPAGGTPVPEPEKPAAAPAEGAAAQPEAKKP